jgi:hypothetical protein
MDDVKKKRFLYGALLVWAPLVPVIIGLAPAFRGIGNEKATGLSVIAAGFAEAFVLIGLLSTIAFEVGAITLLVRGFEQGHWKRALFSSISIFVGTIMLLFVALSVFLMWLRAHYSA